MTGFAKRGKFCQLLWLISTIANRQQFFYIWYQRLFEFLEDAGRSSNTITPTTWLRYTDNDKVKGSFYKKKTWSVWRRAHGWTIRPNRLLWRPFRGFSFLSQLVSLVPANYIKKWSVTAIYKHLTAENCSGFSHGDVRAKSYDLDCRQKQSVVCQVLRYIVNQNVWVAFFAFYT